MDCCRLGGASMHRDLRAADRMSLFAGAAAMALAIVGLSVWRGAVAGAEAVASATCSEHAAMSEAEMRARVAARYATHPERRQAGAPGPIGATFRAGNFYFDADGNLGTAVDTARIFVGQSVRFQWVEGLHTTTSGDPSDPTPGTLWDVPLDGPSSDYVHTFDTIGTYPFFCWPHPFAMRGVVRVLQISDVMPLDGMVAATGFAGGPVPNPTQRGAAVRFGLRQGGRVRLDVFDVSGRVVARVVDRDIAAGRWEVAWDGRTVQGTAPPAGVYWLRLQAPGFVESRRLVVLR